MPTLFHSSRERRLEELHGHLRSASTITPQLIADVMANACLRSQAHEPDCKSSVLRLIDSGAFADAALRLLELELPRWRLRRLIQEDGEWHCALSKELGLPAELDDMAEARHESLPLAILSALVEARRSSLAASEGRSNCVPQIRSAQGHVVCCDNFA
jgi:hypothetical protein